MPKQPPARPPRKPNQSMKAMVTLLDDIATGEGAASRMVTYVSTYKEYMDRDRDILLLNIYSMLKKLTHED